MRLVCADLAEHVAIILAKRGHDLIQQQESVPFERRDLIRLLDLGLTLLGDMASEYSS